MTVRCDKHLFAHAGQYRTVKASPGLAPGEVAELEQFRFGQTGDPAYLDSLAREPAIVLRPLSSGRFGLTRVFKGRADAAGRPTLAFMTLVFPRDAWLASLSDNLRALALKGSDVWGAQSLRIDLPPLPRSVLGDGYDTRTADELSEALVAAAEQGLSLFCYADVIQLPVVSHVVATLPDAALASLSLCYRGLSDSLPVRLACLHRAYGRSGQTPPHVWFREAAAPGVATAHARTAPGPPAAARSSVPRTLPAESGPASLTLEERGVSMDSSGRGGAWPGLAAAGMLLLAICVAFFLMHRQIAGLRAEVLELTARANQAAQPLEDFKKVVAEQVGELEKRSRERDEKAADQLSLLVADMSNLRKEVPAGFGEVKKHFDGELQKQLNPLTTNVADLKDELGGAQATLKTLVDKMDEMGRRLGGVIEGLRADVNKVLEATKHLAPPSDQPQDVPDQGNRTNRPQPQPRQRRGP